MTKEEYLAKVKEIKLIRQREILRAGEEYTLSNARYKIGDTVEDNIGRVIVESVGVYYPSSGDAPCATYWGKELKKDGKFFLNGRKRRVYEFNLVR